MTTLKKVALKASCSKKFTHYRSALRKPYEKLLDNVTKQAAFR